MFSFDPDRQFVPPLYMKPWVWRIIKISHSVFRWNLILGLVKKNPVLTQIFFKYLPIRNWGISRISYFNVHFIKKCSHKICFNTVILIFHTTVHSFLEKITIKHKKDHLMILKFLKLTWYLFHDMSIFS